MAHHEIGRRDFLRAGLATGAWGLVPALRPLAAPAARQVCVVVTPSDPLANAPPVLWAVGELERALSERGITTYRATWPRQPDDVAVFVGGDHKPPTPGVAPKPKGWKGPESLALIDMTATQGIGMYADGADARGLMYALLELVDRVRTGVDPDPMAALHQKTSLVENPSNPVRSVMRQFTSEVLDKPWFMDRDMWPRYLAMLAGHRFNRLHLAFGLGYDTLQQVTDSYLLFLYPFLLDVPGYKVRATNLPEAERDRNLAMLRFISEQTVAHGLEFQLGVWMHGYQLINSPSARYVIDGLTPDTHAAYCRDALTAVLKACPAISSVALRIHGESGIAEGSYDFWQTVFDGVPRGGRTVEIDLHAKGVDQTMIDRALATGMPVNVSPKYWAEHLGMPYHQTAIRDLEMPVAGQTGRGLMTLSEGARSFTRYGYADLLRRDRRYTVRHRIFAGTQRLLLSGDPDSTRAYGRVFGFCGSTGFDVMEPLTCRGRRGTGIAGTRRSGYVDTQLEPRWDWEKYEYWYRVWGRLTYNPDADAEQHRRHFQADGPRAETLARALSSGLARASRILPIVTTAHMPSAACDAYWPEVYWNQPLHSESRPNPYGDTPAPKTFQHVSPLDPQIFSSMTEHAGELLGEARSGKYSPIEVAQWLEDLAAGVVRDLAAVDSERSLPPASRRLVVDARIQADLGHFFAAKFRAGVLYAIYERTQDRGALEAALTTYREARQAWAALAERAHDVYGADLSASDKISERGQWQDRLPAIDADIDRLAQQLPTAAPSKVPRVHLAIAMATATGTASRRVAPPCTHTPPRQSQRNAGVDLALDLQITGRRAMTAVWCYYRHVNQAERFERVRMTVRGQAGTVQAQAGAFHAIIPAAYIDSPYPLQYYFVLHESASTAHLYPGLGPDLMHQPYFVLA
jgi:hypothetical protein